LLGCFYLLKHFGHNGPLACIVSSISARHASYRESRTCPGDRSFDVARPRLWNKLFASLQSLQSANSEDS